MKILTVDDTATVRAMVLNILEPEGFDIQEAANGQDALRVIKGSSDFDVILVDWLMPEMGGLIFLTEVRQKNLAPGVKIIMLTALNRMANILGAMDAGADEYLTKPFTHDLVLERIQTIVNA